MKGQTGALKIFFAIPCGEFFSKQQKIIQNVCAIAKIQPVIVENHHQTDALWEKITGKIDDSIFFVADISSLSPNVIVELGYALKAKEMTKVAVFAADVLRVPIDLQGFVLQKYSSFREFKDRLIDWILADAYITDYLRKHGDDSIEKLKALRDQTADISFHEDFKDFDKVLRTWTFPPLCSWHLTHEGLRFTNAHMPILATTLGLLQNYEFRFKVKIERDNVGWVVKGTKPLGRFNPSFCVMFQLTTSGYLVPHIFNEKHIDQDRHYQVFDARPVNIEVSEERWFEVITRVIGDRIRISDNKENVLFDEDFSQEPFGQFYNDFPNKQGAIGFRCYPDEEAVVNYVELEEL